MRKTYRALIASTAVTAFTTITARAAPATLEPGWYEETSTEDGSTETKKRCITSEEIARGLGTEEDSKEWKVTRGTLANGKIDYAATGPAGAISATGTYTPTSFVMDSKVHLIIDGKPVDVSQHVSARKIGSTCKADE